MGAGLEHRNNGWETVSETTSRASELRSKLETESMTQANQRSASQEAGNEDYENKKPGKVLRRPHA